MNEKMSKSQCEVRDLGAAWEWVLRLRDDNASQEDLSAWLQWYEADERHKQAFEEMQAFWSETGKIADGPHGLTIPRLLGATMSVTTSPALSSFFDSIRAWRRGLAWTGASLVVAVCAFVLWLYWVGEHERMIVASAGPSVVREAVLPDGSRVELAAKSAVTVQYTQKERALEMKSGEAYFSAAHNVERPFIVKVGHLRVQAVGTAFNIRRADDRVVVTVTEGTVDIYATETASDADAESVRVTSGSQVVWTESSSQPTIVAVNTANALAWRSGRLEYLNEPLSAVIADVNRYAEGPVVIRDEAVGELLFSGTVFTDATDVWIQALPSVFPIDIQAERDGYIVLLGRRSSSETVQNRSR